MKSTTNFGLNKPESTDFYNVDDFNSNMDTIDAELERHSSSINTLNAGVNTAQTMAEDAQSTADTATAIAKGKNQARVFATTEKMYEWLSNENNKGVALKGDNLYIIDVGVPDWWISEVLEEPNADGRYYEVAQLETQKVDLTNIIADIASNTASINTLNSNLTNHTNNIRNCSGWYVYTTDSKPRVRLNFTEGKGVAQLLIKGNASNDTLTNRYAVYCFIYNKQGYALEKIAGDVTIAIDGYTYYEESRTSVVDIGGILEWAVVDVISHNLSSIIAI